MRHLLSPAGTALTAFTVLLLFAFAYELSAPQSVPELPRLPPLHHALPRFVSYTAPASETYDEIDRRPLFVASRQAPKAAQEVAANAPPPPPEITLVGIIAGGRSQVALAKTRSSPNATTLSVGSTIDGWEVTAIETDRIVLHATGADYEVRLHPKQGEQAIALVQPAPVGARGEGNTQQIR